MPRTSDNAAKNYLKDPEIFSDLFNFFLYDGRPVISPSSLTAMDTSALAIPYGKSGKILPIERIRDILKNCAVMTDKRLTYIILGLEAQTDIHYAMPVRSYQFVH